MFSSLMSGFQERKKAKNEGRKKKDASLFDFLAVTSA